MDDTITLNGERVALPAARGDAPRLWWLREDRALVGTRYGCGQAVCGACTVHVDDEPVRACVTPCSKVAGRRVTSAGAGEAAIVAGAGAIFNAIVAAAWRTPTRLPVKPERA